MVRDEQYKTDLNRRLDEVTDALVKLFNPERILLFGSFAREEENEDSSIDILIITKTDFSFIQRIKEAIKVTDGDPPVEPLVYTPGEINLMLKQGEGFVDTVLKEGVLLYSRT